MFGRSRRTKSGLRSSVRPYVFTRNTTVRAMGGASLVRTREQSVIPGAIAGVTRSDLIRLATLSTLFVRCSLCLSRDRLFFSRLNCVLRVLSCFCPISIESLRSGLYLPDSQILFVSFRLLISQSHRVSHNPNSCCPIKAVLVVRSVVFRQAQLRMPRSQFYLHHFNRVCRDLNWVSRNLNRICLFPIDSGVNSS